MESSHTRSVSIIETLMHISKQLLQAIFAVASCRVVVWKRLKKLEPENILRGGGNDFLSGS